MMIGIDIGTTFSSVAYLKNGRAERIKPGTETDFSVPSAAYARQDGTLAIGREAVAERMRDPSRFIDNFKRDFGSEIPYLRGGQAVTAYDIYVAYLGYFKESAEAFGGEAVEKAYITHPAGFTAQKKLLLKKAAVYAGLTDVELIDEPTAASLSFFTEHAPAEGETLLIYDLGGGTLDMTLSEVKNGGLCPLTEPLGDARLGGADFDALLRDELVDAFSKERDLGSALKNQKFTAELEEKAVEAKHNLSRAATAYVSIGIGLGDYLEHTLTRERFDELLAPLVDKSCCLALRLIQNAGLAPTRIDRVLLVGGSTRIPYIGRRLEEALGKPILRSADPELAVCMGAVLREVVPVPPEPVSPESPVPPEPTSPEPPKPEPPEPEPPEPPKPLGTWKFHINETSGKKLYRQQIGRSLPPETVYSGDFIFGLVGAVDGALYFKTLHNAYRIGVRDKSYVLSCADIGSHCEVIDGKLYGVANNGDVGYINPKFNRWVKLANYADVSSHDPGVAHLNMERHVYFHDGFLYYLIANGGIFRIRLDGSDHRRLYYHSKVLIVKPDFENGKIYINNYFPNDILGIIDRNEYLRINLDGTNAEQVHQADFERNGVSQTLIRELIVQG